MILVGIIFALYAVVIGGAVHHTAVITNESVLQTQIRTALNQMTKDLREATVSSVDRHLAVRRPPSGVMSPTTLTFYAPDSTYSAADPTAYHLREISYQLSGGQLPARVGWSARTRTARRGRSPALGSWVTARQRRRRTRRCSQYYDGSQPPALTTNPAAVRTVVVTVTVSVPGTTIQFTYSDSATLRETPPS